MSLSLSLGLMLAGQGGGSVSDPDEILLETGDKLLLETGTALVKDAGIPAQSAAGALTGAEYVVVVQSGADKRLSMDRLSDYVRTF